MGEQSVQRSQGSPNSSIPDSLDEHQRKHYTVPVLHFKLLLLMFVKKLRYIYILYNAQ